MSSNVNLLMGLSFGQVVVVVLFVLVLLAVVRRATEFDLVEWYAGALMGDPVRREVVIFDPREEPPAETEES